MTTKPDFEALRELRDHIKTKLLRDVPEFRQFVALEEVIASEENPRIPGLASLEPPPPKPTIEGLAVAAIRKAGEPLPINTLVDEIHRVKKFVDKSKAKINIVSSLSKGKALKSMKWRGGHAWWLAGERAPEEMNGAHQ